MDERVIRRLFVRLGAEFGHKFTSSMPTDQAKEAAIAIWAERLQDLSTDEIRKGIDKIQRYAERHDGWPPGAAEFRALCRPPRQPYERPEFQQAAITQQRADKDTALSHIEQMRQALKRAV